MGTPCRYVVVSGDEIVRHGRTTQENIAAIRERLPDGQSVHELPLDSPRIEDTVQKWDKSTQSVVPK